MKVQIVKNEEMSVLLARLVLCVRVLCNCESLCFMNSVASAVGQEEEEDHLSVK